MLYCCPWVEDNLGQSWEATEQHNPRSQLALNTATTQGREKKKLQFQNYISILSLYKKCNVHNTSLPVTVAYFLSISIKLNYKLFLKKMCNLLHKQVQTRVM